jgi:hypothetical protein
MGLLVYASFTLSGFQRFANVLLALIKESPKPLSTFLSMSVLGNSLYIPCGSIFVFLKTEIEDMIEKSKTIRGSSPDCARSKHPPSYPDSDWRKNST